MTRSNRHDRAARLMRYTPLRFQTRIHNCCLATTHLCIQIHLIKPFSVGSDVEKLVLMKCSFVFWGDWFILLSRDNSDSPSDLPVQLKVLLETFLIMHPNSWALTHFGLSLVVETTQKKIHNLAMHRHGISLRIQLISLIHLIPFKSQLPSLGSWVEMGTDVNTFTNISVKLMTIIMPMMTILIIKTWKHFMCLKFKSRVLSLFQPSPGF